MAYDEQLAERVREVVDNRPYVTEKRMFGGLAWLAHGNMAAAALGGGGAMVRVPKDEYADLLNEPGAEPMVMKGGEMRGWIKLDEATCAAEDTLRPWIERGLAYAEALPRK
ncbi:TfoX/Sxy family protein [Glycomyces sp. TRM65418]|uniref:TfoX/Sxy family protein n=1 Tax=Glycomyces sp. TRM65418 TaxID=2867006 RepID=UPI001CE50E85|nr:TfoX/Sxy family protein [Glycomyces sp. TRM65418]MCC3765121.1 TfoX/Sxy family protein [Glycomyces sp. TRM65418]QZD54750.1 TfoX/Sxy family protein [Glycomyces sp. TRM65418]